MLLGGLVAEHRELAEAVRPWLTGNAAGAFDSVTEQISGHHDEATPDELPQVLADPPWLRPKRKQVLVEGLEPLPLAPVARWRDGQRENWSRSRSSNAARAAHAPDAGSPGQGRLRGLFQKLNTRDRVDVTTAEVAEAVKAICYTGYYAKPADDVLPELQQNVAVALRTGDVTATVTAFQEWATAYGALPGWRSVVIEGRKLCGSGREAKILDRISPGFVLRLGNVLVGTTDSDY